MNDRQTILNSNTASSARLTALAEALSDDDLRRPLGGGWIIATALTHLAFWDFRQAAAFALWDSSGVIPKEDDAVNPALEATARAIDPAAVVGLVLEASGKVDAAVADAGLEAFAALPSGDPAFPVERFNHREEHIAQIEAALK